MYARVAADDPKTALAEQIVKLESGGGGGSADSGAAVDTLTLRAQGQLGLHLLARADYREATEVCAQHLRNLERVYPVGAARTVVGTAVSWLAGPSSSGCAGLPLALC